MLVLLASGAQIQTSGASIVAAKEDHIDIARLSPEKGADMNEINDLRYVVDCDLEYDYDQYAGEEGVAEGGYKVLKQA